MFVERRILITCYYQPHSQTLSAHVSRRFKFVTVRYGRLDDASSVDGEAIDRPAVHTTVVYVPDVWNLQPSEEAWNAHKTQIAAQCQTAIAEADAVFDLVQKEADAQLADATESVAQRQTAVDQADAARNKVTHTRV